MALLSNSSHPRIKALYRDAGFSFQTVRAPRSINSNGAKRGLVLELLAAHLPPSRQAEPTTQETEEREGAVLQGTSAGIAPIGSDDELFADTYGDRIPPAALQPCTLINPPVDNDRSDPITFDPLRP